jgi:hypothetical protein
MAEGDPVRIIPHRGIDDDCGSLEVWFADGRESVRFYWDNLVSRRLSPKPLARQEAIEKATTLARAEMDKLILPSEAPNARRRHNRTYRRAAPQRPGVVVGIPCRARPVYPKPEAAVASHLIAAGIRPPIYLRRCQLDVMATLVVGAVHDQVTNAGIRRA